MKKEIKVPSVLEVLKQRKLEKQEKKEEKKRAKNKLHESNQKTLQEHKNIVREILASNIYQVKRTRLRTRYIDITARQYDPIINLWGLFFFSKGRRLRRQVLRMTDRFVLVRITSLNRSIREFYVPASLEGFTFNKGRYIFDDTNKYWNASARMWCYDYQEPLNIPVKVMYTLPQEVKDVIKKYNDAVSRGINVEVDIDKVKEIIETTGFVDVENAVNPKVLESYLKSNFVQSLVEGASLGKFFRIMLLLLVPILIVVVILLILNGWSSGLFEQVSGAVKT